MASSTSNMAPSPCDSPEELTEILVPENKDNMKLAKRPLVGQLHSTKAQNKAATKGIKCKTWSAYKNLQISDLGKNMFLFTFENENDCSEVLNRSPWFFLNHLMCLHYWIPSITADEMNFDPSPFWVQIHNLPMDLLNAQMEELYCKR